MTPNATQLENTVLEYSNQYQHAQGKTAVN
jgi:hypothetical protein